MQTLSFQAPEEMSAKLASFAKEFDRSKGYLIRQALSEYLEEMEDYLEAKSYKAQYDPDENVSFDEIKNKYGFDQ